MTVVRSLEPEVSQRGVSASQLHSLLNNKNIMVVGDSIAAGWLNKSGGNSGNAGKYARGSKSFVDNESGGNTKGADIIGSIAKSSSKPDGVLVALGMNDIFSRYPGADSYGKNFETAAKQLSAAGIQGYFATITPVSKGHGGLSKSDVNSRIDLVNAQIKSIGEKYGIPVIDLANSLPDNSKYFGDAIHPNSIGYQRLRDKVYHALGGGPRHA